MTAIDRVQDNLRNIERTLEQAVRRAGRKREDVRIVAVTKYVSVDTARAAIEAGVSHIGENRWPDARDKWEALKGQAVFHYIGSLQTNKVRDIVGKFDYIHSLDRLSLAEAIQRRAEQLDIRVSCLVQVNVSGEASKHGLPPEEAESFLGRLGEGGFDRILPVGLMTMAPLTDEPEETRPVFRALRRLRDEWNGRRLCVEPLRELSMGMSGDFGVAVEEGATFIRLGTALVGNEKEEEA